MRTKKFKTLNGLFKSFDLKHLEYKDILNGYLHHNKYGCCNIVLSEDLKTQICNLFASAFCSEKTTKKYAKLIADYNGKNYGIFERITINKKENTFLSDYCAGQNWISETRTIQYILRKGY